LIRNNGTIFYINHFNNFQINKHKNLKGITLFIDFLNETLEIYIRKREIMKFILKKLHFYYKFRFVTIKEEILKEILNLNI